jgi:hypothetical protein
MAYTDTDQPLDVAMILKVNPPNIQRGAALHDMQRRAHRSYPWKSSPEFTLIAAAPSVRNTPSAKPDAICHPIEAQTTAPQAIITPKPKSASRCGVIASALLVLAPLPDCLFPFGRNPVEEGACPMPKRQ